MHSLQKKKKPKVLELLSDGSSSSRTASPGMPKRIEHNDGTARQRNNNTEEEEKKRIMTNLHRLSWLAHCDLADGSVASRQAASGTRLRKWL